MSIELQQTIGYGERATSDECWVGVILQGLQSVFGLLIDAALIGIFFAKMARPGIRWGADRAVPAVAGRQARHPA